MTRPSFKNALRRLEALALAAGTLCLTAVTAGSDTSVGAAKALAQSSPLGAVRWELGDLWTADTLSAAAVLTISQSPLLLSARADVAELWQ